MVVTQERHHRAAPNAFLGVKICQANNHLPLLLARKVCKVKIERNRGRD
jgi:hypothetical protein